MNKSLTVNDIIKIIWKNIIWVILFGVIGAGAMGGFAKVRQHTTYSASRSIMIAHDTSSALVKSKDSQVKADLNMVQTYADLAKDPIVLNKVAKELKGDLSKKVTADELSSMVTVETKPDSLVVSIKASSSNAKDAVKIANKTATVFAKKLPQLATDPGDVTTLAKANKESLTSTTSPSAKKYAVLGLAAGLVIGIAVAFSITSWKKIL
ncbi:MAG: lipopolysaccharide biosynthesis protein [Lactobacillus sp.]|jgi:capsular polysaccharide biosynthesis protein|nr:MAG: lipopolysaccharide biosynthesis protein [Lactobacillus sp.]